MATYDPRDDNAPEAPAGETETSTQHVDGGDERRLIERRRFLQAGVGITVALTVTGLSALNVTGGLRPIATITPEKEPPQAGDRLVAALDQTKTATRTDILDGRPQTMWYPNNPKTGIVKNGTDFNLVLLARFDPASLGPDTAPHAAAGIVAYSAVCTHLCCTVSDWDAKNAWFLCPCHHSLFDPRADGKVMGGPAPRPLPLLPLALDGDTLTVAGGFVTSVGCS